MRSGNELNPIQVPRLLARPAELGFAVLFAGDFGATK
jgi:hypothetical protein